MMTFIKKQGLKLSAAVTIGIMSGAEDAAAQVAIGTGTTGNQDFSDIAANMTESIANLPGLLSGLAYMFGILLGVLGILKIKDHVENPSNAPLSHGAIRLAAGGALFALPMVYEAMQNTIGVSQGVQGPGLNAVQFGVVTP